MTEMGEGTAEFYRKVAAESGGGDLGARLKRLAAGGLLNLVSREEGWELVCAALKGVAAADEMLGRAAAIEVLAADLIYRWGGCEMMKNLGRLVKGEAIAAVAGPEKSPSAPRLSGQSDERILHGRSALVFLAPLAEMVVLFANRQEGGTAVVVEQGTPGVSREEAMPGENQMGLPQGALFFNQVGIKRQNIVGPDPLPPSEPAIFLERAAQIFAVLGLASPFPIPD